MSTDVLPAGVESGLACGKPRPGAGFLGCSFVVGAGRGHEIGAQAGRPRPGEIFLGEEFLVGEALDQIKYLMV